VGWKESVIVHIYRRGDKTVCSKYRDISLLLTTYNILSNILLSRLTTYKEDIIGDNKCGFRRYRSYILHTSHTREWECSEVVHQPFIVSKKAYDSLV